MECCGFAFDSAVPLQARLFFAGRFAITAFFPSIPLTHSIRIMMPSPREFSGICCDNNHVFRKISVPFVPPKPKEFDIATLIFIWRAAFAT
jgi:hypothetical protein